MNRRQPVFWVYVIELETDALHERDRPDDGRKSVYVGYTSHSPAIRLAKHQSAVLPAAAVFRRMIDPLASRLRPDLALYAGPYSTARDARRQEKRMHNRLVADGYQVFGDRGKVLAPRRNVFDANDRRGSAPPESV